LLVSFLHPPSNEEEVHNTKGKVNTIYELVRNKNMEAFIKTHRLQLDALNIPEALYAELYEQLLDRFRLGTDDQIDADHMLNSPLSAIPTAGNDYGSIRVVPHII
jgi:hypothetical protein